MIKLFRPKTIPNKFIHFEIRFPDLINLPFCLIHHPNVLLLRTEIVKSEE